MSQYKVRVNVVTYSHYDVDVIAETKDQAMEDAGELVLSDSGCCEIVDESEIDDFEILEEVDEPE